MTGSQSDHDLQDFGLLNEERNIVNPQNRLGLWVKLQERQFKYITTLPINN